MLSDSAEKKETFSIIKNRIFQSPKKSHFSKGLTHAFNQKTPIFFSSTIIQNKTRNNA